MKIFSIGLSLSVPGVEMVSFDSRRSFLDADLLLVDLANYIYKALPLGNERLDEEGVQRVRATIKRRVADIADFLSHGRPVVYLPVPTYEYEYVRPRDTRAQVSLTILYLTSHCRFRWGVQLKFPRRCPRQ
jgi:hypothetical protein